MLDAAGAGGGEHYYVHDRQYSVTAVLSDSGVIQETYEYEAFGAVTIRNASGTDITSSGSAIGNPYGYTGRRFDGPASGGDLWYYRARWYSHRLGRFTGRDPAGYVDGVNLYAYVRNNPLAYLDPTGMVSRANSSFDGNGWTNYRPTGMLAGGNDAALAAAIAEKERERPNTFTGRQGLISALRDSGFGQIDANNAAASQAISDESRKMLSTGAVFAGELADRSMEAVGDELMWAPVGLATAGLGDEAAKAVQRTGAWGKVKGVGSSVARSVWSGTKWVGRKLKGGVTWVPRKFGWLDEGVDVARQVNRLDGLAPVRGAAGQRLVSSGSQRVIAQSADDVLLGVVDDAGNVQLFRAGGPGSGLPMGHSDLVRQGLVPKGAQGFSVHVSNGRVTTFVRNSALNKTPDFNLPQPLVDKIVTELPMVPTPVITGN